MNKKFFGLLLVGASLFSVCTLESCKDTNTDLCTEISIKATKQYEELKARIDALGTGTGTSCSVDCNALKAEVDALKGMIDTSTADKIKDIEAKIAALEAKYTISGVTVQSVYTPAFGTVNTPVGVNSNILLTYYGTSNTVLNFNEIMVFGDLMRTNAGKIYLTIDPANVDFSGAQLALVNSKGEKIGVKLSELKPADHEIVFGYTRADKVNYLYETAATIEGKDDVKRVSLDRPEIKKAIKDIVNYEDGIDFSALANLVVETVADNQFPLAAVQVEKGGVVLPKYEIMATAVKPLNFQNVKAMTDFVEDGTFETKVNNAVAKLESGQISHAVEKIINKVMPSVKGRISKIANPALFVNDGGNIRLLSADPANPTVLDNATVDLLASSFSLEIVVPFYKKFIKSEGAEITANEQNINGVVVDGSVMDATLKVTGAGVVAINYEVCDFAGNPAKRTCYVKVK